MNNFEIQKQKGKGDAPLWLSTLSAFSVGLLSLILYILIDNLFRFVFVGLAIIFAYIIGGGIGKMIEHKSIRITPNEIREKEILTNLKNQK